MKWQQLCFFLLFFLFMWNISAQQTDTTSIKKEKPLTTTEQLLQKHNPKVAIALSAVIPGSGQIYNKKWWKVPIIYAGLGVSSYLIYDFAVKTKSYQNEYKYRINGQLDNLNPKYSIYTDENVLALKNYYRRNMEISIAALAIIYLLNIVDAAVDAHLFYFDISDDLALSWSPYIGSNSLTPSLQQGVSLAIHFKK